MAPPYISAGGFPTIFIFLAAFGHRTIKFSYYGLGQITKYQTEVELRARDD